MEEGAGRGDIQSKKVGTKSHEYISLSYGGYICEITKPNIKRDSKTMRNGDLANEFARNDSKPL